MKKLSVLLAFLLVLMMVPVGAFTVSAVDYNDGDVTATSGTSNLYYYSTEATALEAGMRFNIGNDAAKYADNIKNATANAVDGDTIYLLQDTAVDSAVADQLAFGGTATTVTLDGNGHTFSSANGRVLNFNGKDQTVTVKNINIVTTHTTCAAQINYGKVIFENCTLRSDAKTGVCTLVVQPGGEVELGNGAVITCKPASVAKADVSSVTTCGGVLLNAGASFGAVNSVFTMKNGSKIDAYGTGIVVTTLSGDVNQNPVININEGAEIVSAYKSAVAPKATYTGLVYSLNVTGGSLKTSDAYCVIADNAKVVITGGTFESGYLRVISAANADVSIYAGTFTLLESKAGSKSAVYYTAYGLTNIYGGTFVSAYSRVLSMAGAGTTVNIYDGTFESTYGADKYSTYYETNGVTKIYGGNFTSGQYAVIGSHGAAKTYIYGGNFSFGPEYEKNAGATNNAIVFISAGDNANTTTVIYGGTFTQSGNTSPCVKSAYTPGETAVREIYGGTFNNGSSVYEKVDSVAIAYADGASSLVLAPEMMGGAGVRLVPDSNGIRFKSVISADLINRITLAGGTDIEYGTYITPYDYLEATHGVFTAEALDAAVIDGLGNDAAKYVRIKAKSGVTTDNAGNITVSAALVNIQQFNVARDFAARAYISYTLGGETVIVYSDFDADENVRSMKQVAGMALADVSFGQTGEYVNEVSSYYTVSGGTLQLVNGTAYSIYTNEQIDALKAYIAD